MQQHASGTFEIKLTPQTDPDGVGDKTIGRLSFDKQFSGDLVAHSKGQMLARRTDTPGSAGYVALERVEGTLHGRTGSFALQHLGVMTRGVASLTVSVVPDSGTDELVGIAGTMTITVVDGRHDWTFSYAITD